MARRSRKADREKYWRGVLVELKASGLSTAAFCRQAGITTSAFYSWKRLIERQDREANARTEAPSAFVPVKISQTDLTGRSVPNSVQVGHVEIWLRSGHVVRAGMMDASALAELARKLEDCKC